MNTIDVTRLHDIDRAVLEDLQQLLLQLSLSAKPITAEALGAMIAASGTELFVARQRGGQSKLLGMLTLVTFQILSGVRAWIEDVVVDQTARRSGIGEALTGAAVARARALGARTVDLTSRPSREAANRLYLKLGFERRDTNVYRFVIRP
jgi:ribosomal protein S18 acetylase RimI-like enzyme